MHIKYIFFFHYLKISVNFEFLFIYNKNTNIFYRDPNKRTALHHAINCSTADANASFESERFLLKFGASVSERDSLNRTPLHYAFIKIDAHLQNSEIDPFETVSSICGVDIFYILINFENIMHFFYSIYLNNFRSKMQKLMQKINLVEHLCIMQHLEIQLFLEDTY